MDITQITDEQAMEFATEARCEMNEGIRPVNDFLYDMGARIKNGKPLSEGQMNGLKKFVVREQEFAARKEQQKTEDANAEDCPTGATQLRGVILSAKYKESQYGTQLKMVLKDERGFRVWMTVPARLQDMVDGDPAEALKGALIEVTATVTPSDDDRVFGFGKQPRDAKLLALAEQVAYTESNLDADVRRAKSAQPVLPAVAPEDAAKVRAQKEQIAADRQAEKAHDAARIAAGTPTAVAQSVLDTLADEDEVKVSIEGAAPITMPWKTGRLVTQTTSNGQPVAVVVGLGQVAGIPF